MSGGVHVFCCFLFGHSRLDGAIYPAIAAAVERHIAIGVHAFVVGRYGQFDALAARAVREAKLRHPQVSLCLLLPYYPPQRSVFEGFDESFYPPGQESVPKRLAIVRANRYMVAHSTHLIACAWRPASNATALLQEAKNQARRGLVQLQTLPPV